MKTLGERIRERRDELDLSLRELAKRLKLSAPFISDVEFGRRFPSDDKLELIARELKLTVEELKDLDPRPPIDQIRRMTEQDPNYALAFRTLINNKVTPEELIKLAGKRGAGRKSRNENDP